MAAGNPNIALSVTSRYSALTDDKLLKVYVRSGHSEAFEEIYSRSAARVWGICVRTLRNNHDAENAFQETYRKLFLKAAKCRNLDPKAKPIKTLARWLTWTAFNEAIRVGNARTRNKKRETEFLDCVQSRNPINRLSEMELYEEIWRLPYDELAPIVLGYLLGYKDTESAVILEIPVGTLKSRKRAARRGLGERLGIEDSEVNELQIITMLSWDEPAPVAPPLLNSPTIAAEASPQVAKSDSRISPTGVAKPISVAKILGSSIAIMLCIACVVGVTIWALDGEIGLGQNREEEAPDKQVLEQKGNEAPQKRAGEHGPVAPIVDKAKQEQRIDAEAKRKEEQKNDDVAAEFISAKTYKVDYVLDGRTAVVILENRSITICMNGISIPKDPEKARAATEFTKGLLQGKDVYVEFDRERRKDGAGHPLVYLLVGEGKLDANAEIVWYGMCHASNEFGGDDNRLKNLRDAEKRAMDEKKGIWAKVGSDRLDHSDCRTRRLAARSAFGRLQQYSNGDNGRKSSLF